MIMKKAFFQISGIVGIVALLLGTFSTVKWTPTGRQKEVEFKLVA